MKIEEFAIRDYGPLPDRGKISLNNFNLFFGKNESGKTLIIDALIKLFLGQNISQFEQINRVDEKPEGYVSLLDDNNQKIKLKGKKLLTNILDLSASEFCNLFIIRDSDLSMYKEEDFYNNITDRLLGLRINDIKKINQELLDIGRLTPSGKFRNIKEEKFEDRMKNAKSCINNIKTLIIKIQDENLDELEEITVKFSERIENLKVEMENYENARKREKYEQGIEALNKLIEMKDQLDNLSIFNDNDIQKWRNYENEIKIYNDNINNLKTTLKQNQEQLNEVMEEIKEKKNNLKIPEKIKRTLDEDIKPEIRNYEVKKGELAGQAVINKFFNYLWIVSAFLFAIFLIFGLTNSLFLFNFLAIFFALLTVGTLIIFKFPYIRKKSHSAGFIGRINLRLQKIGLECESYEDISNKIFNFERDYEIKSEELNRLLILKEKLEDNVNNTLSNKIPENENKIKLNENLINNLKIRSKVETIQDYEEKFTLKKEFEKIFEQQKIILNNFTVKGSNIEENIAYWKNEIKRLEKYKEEAIDIIYSEETVTFLKENLEQLENQLNETKSKYNELKNNLLEVERKVNNILQTTEDYIYCTTTNDLDKVKEKLNIFVKENEERSKDILEICKIFEEIEIKEKEKISKLLSKKSSVFEYFKEITDGLYEEVIFNMDTGETKVKRKDNEFIDIKFLSGGALDQLYFSIRLALAEKVLKNNTGFLILDDPFIKSDPERLIRQIELLKRISKLGWQILYFTSKNEILTNLRPEIENQSIKFIELPSLIS